MAGKVSSDPNVFILPDLGEGLEEAELVAWKVEPGDTVEELQVIAEMETDKALVEVPSPRAGTIKELHGAAGDVLKVGAPFVTYEGGDGDANAAPPEPRPKNDAPSDEGAGTATPSGEEEREDAGTVVGQMSDHVPGMGGGEGKALASPAVRRYARDKGADINSIPGSGIGGRVTKKDIDAALESGGAPSSPARPAPQDTTPETPDSGRRPDTRRPMPAPGGASRPAYQPAPSPAYQQPPSQHAPHQPLQQPYHAPGQHPGYAPYPPPGYGYPPPMPYGYAPPPPPYYGGYAPPPPPGLAPAPGYQGPGGHRPIPDPAQRSRVEQGQDEARTEFRGIRRTIANKLRESVDTAVHFTVMDEADITELDALRKEVSAHSGVKLSPLPFVCAAVARTLGGRFGALNATVDSERDEIVEHGAVHLGIATDTDSGLMVPVIRDADRMDVVTLAREIARVAGAARDRSIPREELVGSTFTISNVGSHAGKFATPVINAPEVGILGIGKAYDGVVVRDGQALVGRVLPLSLACDHRVVDGATGALALAEIIEQLQNPHSIL